MTSPGPATTPGPSSRRRTARRTTRCAPISTSTMRAVAMANGSSTAEAGARAHWPAWARFWHAPLRAERLGLMPSGAALSVDAWRRRRAGRLAGPAYVPAWTVRVLQVQLCMLYLSTGLVKLQAGSEWGTLKAEGTWWEGTSIHYALNYVTM